MDVHAPHEPVHSWKDFGIHLSIVTIGLFIALMLEAGVEYWHHRHVVAEARANIRTEIEANHEAAQRNLTYVQKSADSIDANLEAIHTLMGRPKNFHGSISNNMNFESFHDAAWRTARDTGALSYMPYEEVQRYSDLYMFEEMVNQKAISAAEDDFRGSAPTQMGYAVDALPDAEYTEMLRANAAAKVELIVLKQYVQQLDQQCVEELKR